MRDRELFDSIGTAYNKKDILQASALARKRRIWATVTALEQFLRVSNRIGLGDVLDIGCGAAWNADYLEGHYNTYTGVDYSAALIELAQRRLGKNQAIQLRCDDASAVSLRQGSIDTVIGVGVLHHMQHPEKVLAHIKPAIRVSGLVAFNEPQSSNPVVHGLRWLRKRIDAHYSDAQFDYNPDDLCRQFMNAGYRIEDIRYQGILSTPFAEVALPFQALASLASRTAIRVETLIERRFPRAIRHLTWNVIIVARKTE